MPSAIRAPLARGRKRVGIPRGCAAVTGDETRDVKPLPPKSGGKAAGTRTIRKPEDDPRHASQSNFSAQGKVKRCFAGRFSGSDSPHPRQCGWGLFFPGLRFRSGASSPPAPALERSPKAFSPPGPAGNGTRNRKGCSNEPDEQQQAAQFPRIEKVQQQHPADGVRVPYSGDGGRLRGRATDPRVFQGRFHLEPADELQLGP